MIRCLLSFLLLFSINEERNRFIIINIPLIINDIIFYFYLMENTHTEQAHHTDHFNEWGRKTFETCTKYIEYFVDNLVQAKLFSITINRKKFGPDKKNIFIRSMDGSKKIASAHWSSKQSQVVE